MKYYGSQLLLLVLTLIANSLFAQISKGTVQLSPSINYSSGSIEIDGFTGNIKTSSLDLGIGLGYFIIDNLELSGAISILNDKTDAGVNEQVSQGFAIGPDLKYYVPLSNDFYMPISFGIAYNSITEDDDFSEITLSGIGYGGGVGIQYVLSNKLSLGCSIIYSFGSLEDDDSILEFDLTQTSLEIGGSFLF